MLYKCESVDKKEECWFTKTTEYSQPAATANLIGNVDFTKTVGWLP
jgi:hypothetical protein